MTRRRPAEPELQPVPMSELQPADEDRPRRRARSQAEPDPNRIAQDLRAGGLVRPIGELRRHPQNPRRHPHLEDLKASLRRWGQLKPILVQASTGYIVAGNGLHQAAETLGWSELAATIEELTDAEASAYLLADNRLGEMGDYDQDELLRLMQEADAGDGLAGTGWTVDELERRLRGAKQGRTEADVAPALPEKATWAKAGQLWELGDHRLYVGDSTERRSWDRLMGGEQLDMIWTDPPYGVGYYGKTAEKLTIQGDERDDHGRAEQQRRLYEMAGDADGERLEELLRESFTLALERTRPGRAVYCASPGGDRAPVFYRILMELGVYRQTIIWVKDAFVMGRSDYHWRHEPILHGAKPPARRPRHKEGQPVHYGWKPGAAHLFAGDRTLDTVWEFDRPKASRQHPTMKPVALVERSLLASSKRGAIVGDFFLGSGTTIIAAETSRRRCYGMELDPRYAQVAIERWQEFAGSEARLVE